MFSAPIRFLDWLIPSALFDDPDDLRRAQVVGVMCCVGIVVGPMRAVGFFVLQQFADAVLMLLAAIVSGLVLLALRRGMGLWWAFGPRVGPRSRFPFPFFVSVSGTHY